MQSQLNKDPLLANIATQTPFIIQHFLSLPFQFSREPRASWDLQSLDIDNNTRIVQ